MKGVLNYVNKKISRLSACKYLWWKDSWRDLHQADVLFLLHEGNCPVKYQGREYCHLLDSIKEELNIRGLTSLTVLSPFSSLKGFPQFHGAISRARLMHNMRYLFSKKFLCDGTHNNLYEVNVWKNILQKTKVRQVIAIQPEMYLCKAGHDLGISVSDMQHGVIADEHPGYGERWLKSYHKDLLPSSYFCWDQDSANVINKWANAKGIVTYVIGNPWFIRFMNPKPTDALVAYFKNQSPALDRSKPTILVSLQWGMESVPDRHLFSEDIIPHALKDCILKTKNDINWLIRLHPIQCCGEEKTRIFRYFQLNFTDDLFNFSKQITDLPLPSVLKMVDLHVTYSSSVVIEASWFGIPSLLLDAEFSRGLMQSYYQSERKSGIIEIIPCEYQGIMDWIYRKLNEREQKFFVAFNAQCYDEFLDNMVKKIKDKSKNCVTH